jgi:hypothetical protein
MPTQDQVVQAGICVYDYVLNPAVRGELNRVLAAAKATPDNGKQDPPGFLRPPAIRDDARRLQAGVFGLREKADHAVAAGDALRSRFRG